MNNIHSKVVKLIRALNAKGYVFIAHRKQFYSGKLGKVLTIIKLVQVLDREEYKKFHPKYKGTADYIEEPVLESFKESDILLKLARLYKIVLEQEGDKNEG